ncbi:MAG: hypothetical protein M1834_006418 [Cirrosporium novae-zelandiae]|nr:MAG: hypothetical protein M1834_006418 [Cirrosporium novae-zelandiae]
MASPADAVAQHIAAIRKQLKHVTALVDDFAAISTKNAGNDGIVEKGEVTGSHTTLVQETHKLLNAVKGPLDTVFCHFENVAHTGATRALFEMGVFHKLPKDGTSMTADALAKELNVDKVLLVRLMRMCVIWGPFKETGAEEYAHTDYSLVYLVPAVTGIFKLLVDEYQPGELRFFEFFKKNGWINPVDDRNCPYTFFHRTEGKNMWEYMVQFPDRFNAFNYAMQAQSAAHSWAIALFPYQEIFGKLNTTPETPLVVDIGGGKGQSLVQMQALMPNIKGRYILQERAACLADITDELPGIERMEYDFFTPQPIKGAYIYYLRRIFHDWPDDTCIEILKNITPGITDKTKQRILFQDDVVPEKGADAEAVWSDLTMMVLTGIERTEKQWRALLDRAGYRLEKIYIGPGSPYAVIEAWLK